MMSSMSAWHGYVSGTSLPSVPLREASRAKVSRDAATPPQCTLMGRREEESRVKYLGGEGGKGRGGGSGGRVIGWRWCTDG
jgi:hypothetical protein